jgi:hypothetical protein
MATAKKLIAFIGPIPGINQRGPNFCMLFAELEFET